MGVINEIMQYSALGELNKWYRYFVVLLFSIIVTILFVMMAVLIENGAYKNIQFGY
ncbi:hypothetical protein [uncultured Kriegella sp.]|uniref:hypothetical protein n=1 Tax=uncultured Kriegella sp. TaxID=1798910 RepID=UPI0030D94C2F|tara:strand:+ start:135272 stop:135439 length:168 start_codon:yes stop_codon:yes gene_type:complete